MPKLPVRIPIKTSSSVLGPAGLPAANSISLIRRHVLLLEAGGRDNQL